MCGMLSVQHLLSGSLAGRRFLLRPPEPSSDLLISPPSESIYIGKTKLLRVPFFWNPKKLVNPHICVVGITGSGKSYFVKTFITRASLTFGCGAVILDWAGEYSGWVRAAGGSVLSFGKEGINLLDLAGASPHARIAQVMSALEILTDISHFPAQKSATLQAMELAYSSCGFSLEREGQEGKPPNLLRVISLLLKNAKKGSIESEAAHRLKSLLASSGNSFLSSTLGLGKIISSRLVCIDLHSLPTEQLRSLAGLALLQFIKERMRASSYSPAKAPRLFVVVDEAWKIAADERSDVVSIVREGRKYGFGLIVASQNPTDVSRSIFSNAGTVAAFRLTLASERDYLRSSLSYSDFFESESHNLTVGQALFHLEFSSPVSCPKTFLVSKVDGEELLQKVCIRGEKMELSFEKGELGSRLVAFGLTDAQASQIISEFERNGFALDAPSFASLLERFGFSRALTLSFLREAGAGEKELLAAFSQRQNRPSSLVLAALAEGKTAGGMQPVEAARTRRTARRQGKQAARLKKRR